MEISTILATGDNLKVYLESEESMIQTKIKLQLDFWNNLKAELQNNDLDFKFELLGNVETIEKAVESYYKNSRNNKDYGINLYLDTEQDIYIFITLNHYLYCQIGSEKENDKYMTQLKNLDSNWYEEDEYCSYYLIKPKLNFNDFLDTPRVFDLLNIDKSNEIINDIVNEIKNLKNSICSIIEAK